MEEAERSNDLSARVEHLERLAAIEALIYQYALNIRGGREQDCVELFAEDAIFEVREAALGDLDNSRTRSRAVGRKAISDYLARSAASGARVCPLISNVIVRLRGFEATSDCAMTTTIWPTGSRLIGHYQDSYRYDDGWRFSARVFTILGQFGPDPSRP